MANFQFKEFVKYMFERFAAGHMPTDEQIESGLQDYLKDHPARDRRRIELFEGKDKQWYWRLLGGNGEKMAQSEGYTRKSGAIQGIADALKIDPEAQTPPEYKEVTHGKKPRRNNKAEA